MQQHRIGIKIVVARRRNVTKRNAIAARGAVDGLREASSVLLASLGCASCHFSRLSSLSVVSVPPYCCYLFPHAMCHRSHPPTATVQATNMAALVLSNFAAELAASTDVTVSPTLSLLFSSNARLKIDAVAADGRMTCLHQVVGLPHIAQAFAECGMFGERFRMENIEQRYFPGFVECFGAGASGGLRFARKTLVTQIRGRWLISSDCFVLFA